MKKHLFILPLLLCSLYPLKATAEEATILINGVPVKQLYVDSEGRLYLTPGEGRKPVKIEIPKTSTTTIISKEKKLKVGGKAYLHWDYDMQGAGEHNEFKITRNYIELRGYFNSKNYFRATLDVKQDSDVDGGSYVARLKYAYIYFSNVLLHTGVELGLVHRPWIDWEEHHGWLHRDLEETLIENKRGAHLINSADLGMNFKGSYGIASWEFGVFNGEGYHDEEESEHFGKSIEARLSLNPFKGFFLSGHTVHSFDHKGENFDRHIYQVHAVYNSPYFLIAAQYILDKDNYYSGEDVTQKGYSINGDLKFKPLIGYDLGILGRYDHWDPNDDIQDDEKDHYVVGVFYKYSSSIKFTLAGDKLIADTNSGFDDANTLMFVTEVNW